MLDKIDKKFQESYFLDLKKPDIDKFERAAILGQYLKTNRMSIRSFGEKFNISKSTIEDWLLYNRITKKEYNGMMIKGYTPMQVYKTLRDNKIIKKLNIEKSAYDKLLTDLDNKTKSLIKGYKKDDISDESEQLIKDLINNLNRLLMRIEKWR